MKTYEDMIKFAVVQAETGYLQHLEFTAVILLSEAYEKTQANVREDMDTEYNFYEQARRAKRKADAQAANEARRLANIARRTED